TIDVLINNAGGVFPRQKTSADEFEMTFAVNHLGHFALTTSLLDILLPSKARVINVSSEAHRTGKLKIENLKPSNSYRSWGAYGTAKLCNIYFTTELHRRFASEGLTSYALHPGVVNTHFFTPFKGIIGFLIRTFSFLLISPEKGAETQIFLATAPDLKEQSGEYFKNKKVKKPSSQARNSAAAKKLWEVSEQYLKEGGTK
nr:SDR family NAD(P)-dependent oxidoreductase [Saprospiraceae bacterium]